MNSDKNAQSPKIPVSTPISKMSLWVCSFELNALVLYKIFTSSFDVDL